MRKAEYDWAEVSYPETEAGRTESVAHDADHQPHVFLYDPDLSAQKGWSAHQVPERTEKSDNGRRPMGFRR